jgi:transcriptional regulator with XRE-family HTH domain
MKTFGERIRELRDEKDISLRELSKKLDVSAAFLSDVELGRRYPSEKVLARITEALGVSVEDLKSYDTRAPIEDLKRLTSANPRYGFALRKVVDQQISAEDLIKFIDGKSKQKNKK